MRNWFPDQGKGQEYGAHMLDQLEHSGDASRLRSTWQQRQVTAEHPEELESIMPIPIPPEPTTRFDANEARDGLIPSELGQAISWGLEKNEQQDWIGALHRWSQVRTHFPSAWEGYGLASRALRELGRLDDAMALLIDAAEQFPQHVDRFHDLARLAEARRDWVAAELFWCDFISINPRPWWAYTSLASALHEQGRVDEAEAALVAVQGAMPGEPAVFAEHARLAESRRDWPKALERWQSVIDRFPDQWIGYCGVGTTLRETGRLEDARNTLIPAVERFPNEAQPIHDLARISERLGDWEMAERLWRRFISINARMWWAHTSLASALREQGRVDEAEATLVAAQDAMPGEPAVFAEHARLAESRRDWPNALERWQSVIDRFPDQRVGSCGVGRMLRETGRLDDARITLSSAVERFPKQAQPIHDLARISERLGDWEAAERLWRRFISIDPRMWWAHTSLASALREQGRLDEAEATLVAAQDAIPGEPAVFAEHARLAESRRDWAKALERWQSGIDRFPDQWIGYAGLASALREQGRLDEAEATLVAAQGAMPGEPAAFAEHARLAESRRDWPKALERWQSVIDRFPDQWIGYFGVGRMLRETGRLDDARNTLSSAVERFPKQAQPIHDLARISERLGDWEAAERLWRRFISIDPMMWWAHTSLASALREQGRVDEAEQVLRNIQEIIPEEAALAVAWSELAAGCGDYAEAVRRYEVSLSRLPDSHDINIRLIDALLRIDMPRKALHYILIARSAWPSDTDLCQRHVEALLRMNDSVSALEVFQTIPEVGTIQTNLKYSLAWNIYASRPPEEVAATMLVYLASQPDPGDRLWLPYVSVMATRFEELRGFTKNLLTARNPETAGPAFSVVRCLAGEIFSDAEIVLFFSNYLAKGRMPLVAYTVGYFYSAGRLGVKEHIGRLFERYLSNKLRPGWQPSPIELWSYFVFAAVFSERAFADLLGFSREFLRPLDAVEPLSTVIGALTSMVREARLDSQAHGSPQSIGSPAVVGRVGKPRVAVCVSGQLRGYESARQSWEALDFGSMECQYFVSVWETIGQNWNRAWSAFRRYPVILSAINGPAGMDFLRLRYPRLAAAMLEALRIGNIADINHLREFYGTRDIEVADDNTGLFAHANNTWKMYYKIGRAHEMAVNSGKDFDLYVRIRPDQRVDGKRELDWRGIAAMSARQK